MHIVTILRYYLGLTQTELSQKAGVSYADLNEIENKPNYGMIDKYRRLAEFLHVPVHTVVTNDFLGVSETFFAAMAPAEYMDVPKSKTAILGRQGEDSVFEMERERLMLVNPCLGRLVLPCYKLRATRGFDILSYKEDGTPFLIEVKTSEKESGSTQLTKFEYETAEKWTNLGYDYWIYNCTNWGKQAQKIEKILFKNLQNENRIEPVRYICNLREMKDTENGILHFRKKMGYSQIEAANMLEIPVSCLCKYETGENQCPVTAYQKISELYGVKIDELLQEYPAKSCG